ncbi:hypothetical protein GGX14DRAFT_559825 [Mycena pura]|uniref:Uncharacterized protein n=1 Tax=Mycena pura TaxID=153505 RepID=A0AAD6VQH2_9AGAR|nr:hypothetical protein GGX14DRAFT_559825 [Mycena pura]
MPSGDRSAAIASGKPKLSTPHPVNDRFKKCASCRGTTRIAQAHARAKKAASTQESDAESEGEEHVDRPQKTSEERPKKKRKVAGHDADSDVDSDASDEELKTSYTSRATLRKLRSVMKTTEDSDVGNNSCPAPRTWENADAMFYCPIPRIVDRNMYTWIS